MWSNSSEKKAVQTQNLYAILIPYYQGSFMWLFSMRLPLSTSPKCNSNDSIEKKNLLHFCGISVLIRLIIINDICIIIKKGKAFHGLLFVYILIFGTFLEFLFPSPFCPESTYSSPANSWKLNVWQLIFRKFLIVTINRWSYESFCLYFF